MTEKRLLALLGMILGLIAGVLILADVVIVRGNPTIDLDFVVSRGVQLVVAIALLFGSVLLYRGRGMSGGLVNLIFGIVAFAFGYGELEAVAGVLSGILGLLAGQTAS